MFTSLNKIDGILTTRFEGTIDSVGITGIQTILKTLRTEL